MDKTAREDTTTSLMSRFRQVPRVALVLVGTAIIGRIITLLTQVVIAHEFGLSIYSDAYFAMEQVPELFVSFVAAAFSMVFIPLFAEYRITQGDREAWRFASSFFILSVLISVLFGVIAVACSPHLVSILAPGFPGPTRQIAITLLRIMALSIIFFGLDAGMLGLLHSHREFIIPELARMTYNLVLLGVAFALSSRFGVIVLAWGIVAAALIRMTIQSIGAVKRGAFKPVLALFHPGTGRAAKLLIPFVIAISGMQIIFVLDRMVASGLAEGSVAALNYAGRIILIPVGIFVLPLRTILYPTLSDFAVKSQINELAETTLAGIKILLFIVIPACVGLVALRIPLISLLFERGAFDHLATLATSEVLIFYAAGVPAIAGIFFLTNVYFSLGDPYTLIKLNLVNWSTNLILNLILGRYLDHRGIALATAISTTLTVILMLFIMKRYRLKHLDVRSLMNSLCKIVSISAVMGFVLILLPRWLNYILVQLRLNYQFFQVLLLTLIGAATYLTSAYILRIDELSFLKMVVRGRSETTVVHEE